MFNSRCKNKDEISVRQNQGVSLICGKCSNTCMVAFRPAIVHQFSAILGYFDVKECHAFDLVLSESEFMVGCEKCNKEMKVQVCITGTPLLFSNLVEFIYRKVTTYRVKGLKTKLFFDFTGYCTRPAERHVVSILSPEAEGYRGNNTIFESATKRIIRFATLKYYIISTNKHFQKPPRKLNQRGVWCISFFI